MVVGSFKSIYFSLKAIGLFCTQLFVLKSTPLSLKNESQSDHLDPLYSNLKIYSVNIAILILLVLNLSNVRLYNLE